MEKVDVNRKYKRNSVNTLEEEKDTQSEKLQPTQAVSSHIFKYTQTYFNTHTYGYSFTVAYYENLCGFHSIDPQLFS